MTAKTYLLIWAAALVTLSGAASLFTHPGSMDAYYYYHVASNLSQGRGLVEDFIWNYLSNPSGIPQPSNLYWMPLTSFIAAPFLWAFGDYFRSAQAPFVLLASLAPPMSAAIIWASWRSRGYAIWSALFTLFGGFYLTHWVGVDSFAPFFLATTASLFMMALLLSKDNR
ncbi:MAG: putative rane protein, partial [Dehalococcoidia bacterium]|nr:putative rane protein [Dehalococcoidia bacterium]